MSGSVLALTVVNVLDVLKKLCGGFLKELSIAGAKKNYQHPEKIK